MPYRTRKDVTTHTELLNAILTFEEIFCYIFHSAGNPRIEIMAYEPATEKSHLFEISTKYQRNTTEIIKNKFEKLISETDFLREFDNISEVSLNAKGTVRGRQIIYSNPDTPWSYHSMLTDKTSHCVT